MVDPSPPMNVLTLFPDTDDECRVLAVIINRDRLMTTFYDLDSGRGNDPEIVRHMATEWWFETSRIIPLPVYMGPMAERFDYMMRDIGSSAVRLMFEDRTYDSNQDCIRGKRVRKTLIHLESDERGGER